MTAAKADDFLGGRVTVVQPEQGFRSGLDAVMLAAAVPADPGDELLELGAGAGAASLCLVARAPQSRILGVEIDPALVELAQANAARNKFSGQLIMQQGDVLALPGLLKREFAHVFTNPPFHDSFGEPSPRPQRDVALRDVGRLGDWIAMGARRTVSGGTFTVIVSPSRLANVMAELPGVGVTLFPLWPRAGQDAKRVIVQYRKGSRAPLRLLPGLVLHGADGGSTPEAEAVLRHGAALALAGPRL
jgi:tRNA1(Val) A37 N6-methylase TrmN6